MFNKGEELGFGKTSSNLLVRSITGVNAGPKKP
jgi:hypothetical protein